MTTKEVNLVISYPANINDKCMLELKSSITKKLPEIMKKPFRCICTVDSVEFYISELTHFQNIQITLSTEDERCISHINSFCETMMYSEYEDYLELFTAYSQNNTKILPNGYKIRYK